MCSLGHASEFSASSGAVRDFWAATRPWIGAAQEDGGSAPANPRLDSPHVTNVNNFIIEYHLIDAMVYLGAVRAGRVWELEEWAASLPPLAAALTRRPRLKAMLG